MSHATKGFASLTAEERRKIASMGGLAVPKNKRGFSQNRELAKSAGRLGGLAVAAAKRSFSDPEKAREASAKARAKRKALTTVTNG